MRRRRHFHPFGSNGRRTIAAIMLAFALYTGLTLVLSARTATRAENRAQVLEVAARQRTLAERYAKEVLLGANGSPSAPAPIAHDLEQSAAALLDGGVAPAVEGDDDAFRVQAVRGALVRAQLEQEQGLIHDLVATGSAVLSGASGPLPLTAHEHYPRALTPTERLTALTGLTSNVSLNVVRSIGNASDRNVSNLISLQRLLAAISLGVFGVLGFALVASTRRRNAHFRSLVTSTTDLVLVFSEGRCSYASNSVLRLLGCPEGAVLGDGIDGFVHPDDLAGLDVVLSTGSPSTVELRLQNAGHGWRSIEANVTDLREDRHVRGVVLNGRDVTERNRAEAERERLLEQELLANERLRQLDSLKDEFVALVSHEVRTPLTSIVGYLELLAEQGLTDEQQAFTSIIERNSERLMRLTNDLLVIAQIDGGRLTVAHDDVDLGAVLSQAVSSASPAAAASGIALTAENPATLPLVGDAGRLAQLFDNLISNAVKFTPAGGSVDVASGVDGDTVWVEVRDTGIGVSQGDQEHLFDRFFRTDAAAKASIQGTGLGLAICKAIVQAHGGTIDVESAEGTGTTMRVELPAAARVRRQPAVASRSK